MTVPRDACIRVRGSTILCDANFVAGGSAVPHTHRATETAMDDGQDDATEGVADAFAGMAPFAAATPAAASASQPSTQTSESEPPIVPEATAAGVHSWSNVQPGLAFRVSFQMDGSPDGKSTTFFACMRRNATTGIGESTESEWDYRFCV